jgi:hypothetical protein
MTKKYTQTAAAKMALANQGEVVERLARLETEGISNEKRLGSMEKKLDTVIERFTRYEAKWGGIFMVLSAILGLLTTFHSSIQKFFSGR